MKRTMLSLLICVLVFSCSKKKDDAQRDYSKTYIGFWKGPYVNTGNGSEGTIALLFNSNGTLWVYDLGKSGNTADTATTQGKFSVAYTVTDNKFSGSSSLSGQINEPTGELSGKMDAGPDITVTFTATRQH
ncbi:hypothetical protein [Niabella hirudinis]|uniref:hypothetical protein n=1 Tax=Niabella hirudinis TaxID=1285929 RepID=UPI003EBDE518